MINTKVFLAIIIKVLLSIPCRFGRHKWDGWIILANSPNHFFARRWCSKCNTNENTFNKDNVL